MTRWQAGRLIALSSYLQLTIPFGQVSDPYVMGCGAARYANIFSVTVNLPTKAIVQYKYIRKHDGVVKWESDPNNQITTPGSGSLTQDDAWR